MNLEQPEADFAYARLPERLGDSELKRRAMERIAAHADHAIDFSLNQTTVPAPCHWFYLATRP